MTARVIQEVQRFQKEGPSDDFLNRAKETAKNNYQQQLRQNGYWLGRFQAVNMWGQDPSIIAKRLERINALTPAMVQEAFKKYFPSDRRTVITLLPAPK